MRPVEQHDFAACLRLLRGRCAYPAEVLAQIPRAWRRLLVDDAILFSVVEDHRHVMPRIVALGASVFVTDAFMREARAGVEPYLSARVIRQELSGPSPILRRAAIARANAGDGLNLIVLHYGEARDEFVAAELRHVRYRVLAAFVEHHRGFCLKGILQEFWDEIEPSYFLQGWGRVLTDYPSYFERRGLSRPPLGRRPHLIGLTKDEAFAMPGRLIAPLFVWTAPRFGLSGCEQRLLARALHGPTDPELASGLGVTLATVKARWRAIYDRVGLRAPELISSAPGDQAGRGKEKRRRLLEYLRQHPEELTPWVRSTWALSLMGVVEHLA